MCGLILEAILQVEALLMGERQQEEAKCLLPLEEPIKAYWLGLSDHSEDGRRWKGVFLPCVPRNSKCHHPPAALPRLSWNVFKACEKPLVMTLNPEDLCLS